MNTTKYALTNDPIIYDSLVKQLWSTATLRSSKLGPPAILATINETPYTITEESVRSQLQLADNGGIDDLPIAEIYSGMDNLGRHGNFQGNDLDITTVWAQKKVSTALIVNAVCIKDISTAFFVLEKEFTLLSLEITCSCFHGFIDKDLINLVLPDVRRYVVVLTGIYYHLKELRCCAQCLIEDEDFIKRSMSTLGEEVEMITSQLQGKLWLYDEVLSTKEDTTYQRLDFTRKRVFSLPNTAYPSSFIRRIQLDNYSENSTDTPYPSVGYDVSTLLLRTTSFTKELITPFENPERVFRSKRRLFETPGLVESSSPKSNLFSNIEEEETTYIMTETMQQYMRKTRGNTGRIVEAKINEQKLTKKDVKKVTSRWIRNEPSGSVTNWETLKTKFLNKYYPPARAAKKMKEINNFQQEPDESLFRAWERFKELLMKCPQHYLTDMQEVILFYNGLDVPTRQILDSKGAIPTKTAVDAKVAIQEMVEYSQKWHNGTSSKARSIETSDGLAAIQAQLNNLGREIKKVNEKVYAAQVGCELCKGPHYKKDCPLKKERKTLEEAYCTQFGAPYQPGGQYRAAGPGFYQRNNRNYSYPDQRQTLEESLTKFMAESAKRHKENSNIIKEI
ncbi:hypothetical protein Tco_0478001 [Tanacetum coccineum]